LSNAIIFLRRWIAGPSSNRFILRARVYSPVSVYRFLAPDTLLQSATFSQIALNTEEDGSGRIDY
jgi:hypothetical protein